MMRHAWFLLVFATLCPAQVEKISMVIGNNNGLASEKPLEYAADDARMMHEILTTLGGVSQDRSYLLLNSSPRAVSDALREIAGRVKELRSLRKSVQLFVYYSGHGGNDALHLQGERFAMTELRTMFDQINADLRILVVDACHSGALISPKGGSLTPAYDIRLRNELGVSGTVFITSSSPYEFSHESRELRGSLFTYYFASALRGAADYDHDNQVSLWEAYSFAKVNTQRQGARFKSFSQNPEFDFDIAGNQNVSLTDLNNARSSLSFHGCLGGAYEIFEQNGMRQVAGFYITAGDSARIVVPRATYLVRNEQTDKVYIATIDLNWGGNRQVYMRDFKPFPVDVLVRKGGNFHFKPHALTASGTFMQALPEHAGTWLIPELAYHYSFYSLSLHLQAGYTRDAVSGSTMLILRSLVTAALSANYYLVNLSRFKYFSGGQCRIIVMNQQPLRSRESEIRALGFAPLPQYRALIGGFGVVQGVRLVLPVPVALEAQVIPGIYLASDYTGVLQHYFRVPVTLAAFWRF